MERGAPQHSYQLTLLATSSSMGWSGTRRATVWILPGSPYTQMFSTRGCIFTRVSTYTNCIGLKIHDLVL